MLGNALLLVLQLWIIDHDRDREEDHERRRQRQGVLDQQAMRARLSISFQRTVRVRSGRGAGQRL
jgi:hypothetical protein